MFGLFFLGLLAFITLLCVVSILIAEEKILPTILTIVAGVATLGSTVGMVYEQIEPGTVGVVTTLGTLDDDDILEQGPHWINPMSEVYVYNIQRQKSTFEKEVISSDRNPLMVDAVMSWQLQPQHMPKLFEKMRGFADFINKWFHNAVFEGFSNTPWKDAVGEGRDELANIVELKLRESIASELEKLGVSPNAIVIHTVKISSVIPDKKILNAIAEKEGAKEDLERQETLTMIAAEEAKRRANEGDGIKQLMENLPEGFTPADIRLILDGVSNKTKAEAFSKAVEAGVVDFVIMDGSQSAISQQVK